MPYDGFEPKSACRNWRNESMRAMYVAELGSTGALEMSWFHGLSGGNTSHPPSRRTPVTAVSGSGVAVAVTGESATGDAADGAADGPAVSDGGAVKSGVAGAA